MVAIILAVAATLKLHAWWFRQGALNDYQRATDLAWISFEYVLAGWLFSGIATSWAQRACIAVFLIFAVVSLYAALTGKTSCGCFGRVSVNPWMTFAFDSVVALAIYVSSRPSGPESRSSARAWHLVSSFVATAVVAAATWTWLHRASATGQSLDDPALVGRDVVLQPQTWIGRQFPLSRYTSPALTLHEGAWTVVIFHHDCPACTKVLPKFEALAKDGERVALIELPPYKAQTLSADSTSRCTHARLASDRTWIVQTPVVIHLAEGVVVRATEGSE